eukprot:Gregarina_sp_Poly_1__1142@NODE_127_length_13318_cov_461_829220_g113_i0_p10_GENE_NODE_127_length_13318_cov_461_829220_g113_i0NODE_127_length_13318_cov_461_829220_g113_i0_p10_ORF_typecomplete_len171_score21_95_NODE_127_length_13318_cov_461_829220_g113_i034473959
MMMELQTPRESPSSSPKRMRSHPASRREGSAGVEILKPRHRRSMSVEPLGEIRFLNCRTPKVNRSVEVRPALNRKHSRLRSLPVQELSLLSFEQEFRSRGPMSVEPSGEIRFHDSGIALNRKHSRLQSIPVQELSLSLSPPKQDFRSRLEHLKCSCAKAFMKLSSKVRRC